MLEHAASVLKHPTATKWLFERRPINNLTSEALDKSVGFHIVLSQPSTVHPGERSSGSEVAKFGSYETGTSFLLVPVIRDGDVACGAFFGENRPPYPGGYPAVPTTSRWAADIRRNILVQFIWFDDDSLCVGTCAWTQEGHWLKEFVFFEPFPEEKLPSEVLFHARFVDRRDCDKCFFENSICICRPVPTDLDALFRRPLSEFAGGALTCEGFGGNFVAARTGNYVSYAEMKFKGAPMPKKVYCRNFGTRFNEMEDQLNKRLQIFQAGYTTTSPMQDARLYSCRHATVAEPVLLTSYSEDKPSSELQ
mmetsp:Transcript_16599/g.40872  ORF Transcript_16599/g.40872 Transcript_16599/m.40872 type:complete len:307 (+) Transcript_16599:395-1315(+)